MVNIEAHQVFPPCHCIVRGSYLHWLLMRLGILADLHLGVRLDEGQLLAHARVEWAGHPLNEKTVVGLTHAHFKSKFFNN